jgi:hypothetical protein
MVAEKDSAWLRTLVARTLVKNGVARFNGNRSWELLEREFLFLTPELAEGFLSFSKNPVYAKEVVGREQALITAQSGALTQQIGNEPFNLIDVYCGDGAHAVHVIREFNAKTGGKVPIRYCPMNATSYLTEKAIANVTAAKFSNVVAYEPILSSGDGHALRAIGGILRTNEFKRHVVLVLESVLASFEINDYLFEMARDFLPSDVLVIGNGIRTGERLVELPKYADRSFHQWFRHLLRDLGFSEKTVTYDARFGNSRVELFYRLLNSKRIQHNGQSIELAKGDEFVVGVLYKYFEDELRKFCEMYFSRTSLFTDADKGYALAICRL